MSGALLQVKNLSIHFGGLRAVDGVDFEINRGEIFGLLGPNGAGKTVTFNLISGVYKPSGGEVWFDGRRIDGLPPHAIAALGLGRTFQIVKPFPSLTVLDNVLVARGISRYPRAASLWTSWRSGRERREAMALLERVGLADLARRKAGLLPLGNLRRLEIARALAVGRKLLLLDESFSGLRHGGDRQAGGPGAGHPRPGGHGAAHRAQHAGGHGPVRPHRGPGPRAQAGRGPARGHPAGRERDRGVPGAEEW